MFDLLFLNKYIPEMNEKLANARVDKIYHPNNLELAFILRNPGETLYLKIDCTADNNHLRITEKFSQNPTTPTAFCMLLRKYLSGSKIKTIEMVDNERIINLIFQGRHPNGFVTDWVLAIELMGRHSNVIFYENEDKTILGLLKPTTSEVRELKVGQKYQFPPQQSKLSIKELNTKKLLLQSLGDEKLALDKVIVKYFPLASPMLVKEFIYQYSLANKLWEELEEKEVENIIKHYLNFINNLSYQPVMYYDDNSSVKDFYCINLQYLVGKYTWEIYPNFLSLVQDFYDERESEKKLKNQKTFLTKHLEKIQKKLTKKLQFLNDELHQYQHSEKYKEIGDLLMSNLHQIKKGMTEITLYNYYTSSEERIKLDPSLSPINNCQNYYKKHSKSKRGIQIVKENIEKVQQELDYIDSLLHFVNIGDIDVLTEIEQELIKENYLKVKENKNKKDRESTLSQPLEFTSTDGYKILVGKNNKQNDLLTLKIGKKGDLWLHTKDIPGSHVIIKNGTKAPDATILEAANLAAFYSKAKHSSKVAVDYTDVKNVFKPKGAKPGMVNYVDFKTIYVTPSINIFS